MTVGVGEGDRIGIVGRNGDGKSSLLAMLAGRLAPNSGRVTRRDGVTIGLLDQGDTLDPALTVARTIVGDGPEYEWAGDARIRDVIGGLVREIGWQAPVAELSGGQRRRVALARLLVGDWDVLALDEPTNHLDIEGITWLAGHLRARWPANAGGLLVVTHDRWFLDEVCTTTWEVHDRIIEPFDGGYAAYVLQRVERDRMAAASEAKRQNLMRKELAWLRRGAPARTTKAKFRVEAATELIASEPPPRNQVELARMATARLGKDVVDLLDVSVSFGDQQVLRDVEWRIGPGERTGILGVNGAGKSTLLKLVSGELEPTQGRVKRGKTVQVAVLDQQLAALDDSAGERVSDLIARQRTTLRRGREGAEPSPAAGAPRLHQRAAVDPGAGPVRRAAAPPAAAADPARRAERAHPRRADERHGRRHAGGVRGPAGLLAGHAAGRVARPLLHSSGSPTSSTRSSTGTCGTCPAAWTSTSGSRRSGARGTCRRAVRGRPRRPAQAAGLSGPACGRRRRRSPRSTASWPSWPTGSTPPRGIARHDQSDYEGLTRRTRNSARCKTRSPSWRTGGWSSPSRLASTGAPAAPRLPRTLGCVRPACLGR